MAFAFVAISSQSSAAASTLTVAKPTGTVDGDYMVAVAQSVDTAKPTPPAGWTERAEHRYGSASYYKVVWTKPASSEGADYDFAFGTTRAPVKGRIDIITCRGGFNPTTPYYGVVNAEYTTLDTSIKASGATVPTAYNPVVIFIGCTYHASITISITPPATPNAFTEDAEAYGTGTSLCNVEFSHFVKTDGLTPISTMIGTLNYGLGTHKHAFALILNGWNVQETSAALVGESALAAVGKRKVLADSDLSGGASLIAEGTRVRKGAAALTGQSSLVTYGGKFLWGAAALAGDGALSATGLKTKMGRADLAGESTLAAAGWKAHHGVVALTGESVFTAQGATTGIGTLYLAPERTRTYDMPAPRS